MPITVLKNQNVSSLIKKLYRGNLVWSFSGNLLYAFSQWYLLSVLAKLSGTKEMGIVTYCLAIVTPLSSFFNFQLRNIQVTTNERGFNFAHFITFRFITNIVMMLGVIGFSLYKRELSIYIILLGVVKFIESLSDIFHGYFQKEGRLKYAGISLIIRAVLSVTFITIAQLMSLSLGYTLLTYTISFILILVLFDYPMYKLKFSDLKFDIASDVVSFKAAYSYFIKNGFSLGLTVLIIALVSNIPRIYLEEYTSLETVAIFSGLVYILMIGRIFVQSMSQDALPKYSNLVRSGDIYTLKKLVANNIRMVIGVVVSIGVVVVPLSDIILTSLYNDDFLNLRSYLIIVMISSIFSFSSFFLNNVINAFNKYRVQLPIYVSILIFSIVLNFYSIKVDGIRGALIGLLLTNMFQFLLLTIIVYRTLRDALNN